MATAYDVVPVGFIVSNRTCYILSAVYLGVENEMAFYSSGNKRNRENLFITLIKMSEMLISLSKLINICRININTAGPSGLAF